eukprot:COSAG01_NODE_12508_length_1727_cov_8.904791_2_plen_58_part_00
MTAACKPAAGFEQALILPRTSVASSRVTVVLKLGNPGIALVGSPYQALKILPNSRGS